eukprot:6318023-Prymnesium_polylepis.1
MVSRLLRKRVFASLTRNARKTHTQARRQPRGGAAARMARVCGGGATWRAACHAAMCIQRACGALRGPWGPTSRAGAGRRALSMPAR